MNEAEETMLGIAAEVKRLQEGGKPQMTPEEAIRTLMQASVSTSMERAIVSLNGVDALIGKELGDEYITELIAGLEKLLCERVPGRVIVRFQYQPGVASLDWLTNQLHQSQPYYYAELVTINGEASKDRRHDPQDFEIKLPPESGTTVAICRQCEALKECLHADADLEATPMGARCRRCGMSLVDGDMWCGQGHKQSREEPSNEPRD